MAKKRIFTVGFYLPGDDFEFVPFESDQSLLDADIVLYEVGFGDNYPTETYQGEPLLNHYSSARLAICDSTRQAGLVEQATMSSSVAGIHRRVT